MGSTKTVNTILRGAEILKVLAKGITRLEDIYPEVDLNKSSTHRILKSLVETGLVYQDPAGRTYHIGPLLLRISSSTTALHHLLIVCASGELRHLAETIHETVLLIIPLGDRRLVLKEVPSDQRISLSLGEGSTMPIVVGSSGRVLLSQYDDRTLKQVLSHIDLRPLPGDFLTDTDRFIKEIEQIRHRGYALSSGVMLPGSSGISVPVKGYVCPVALCILGPKFRFEPLDILPQIRESAQRISEKLKSLLTGAGCQSKKIPLPRDHKSRIKMTRVGASAAPP